MACNHDWVEEYYGVRCSVCGVVVPDGCGWWLPVDAIGDDLCDECECVDDCIYQKDVDRGSASGQDHTEAK